MDDLIRRSEAIKAITGEPIDAHYPSWYVDAIEQVPLLSQLWSKNGGDEMSDLISRQATIYVICKEECGTGYCGTSCDYVEAIERLPSAQPEQLTDAEQRIFLKAIEREEKVCKKVDEEWGSGDEECEINLVHACHEIIRKVKGALWT